MARTAYERLRELALSESEECADWDGAGRNGYGALKVNGKLRDAHVVALELAAGPRPDGMVAAHLCGNKKCVRASHLVWATRAENCAHEEVHRRTSIAGPQAVRYLKALRACGRLRTVPQTKAEEQRRYRQRHPDRARASQRKYDRKRRAKAEAAS